MKPGGEYGQDKSVRAVTMGVWAYGVVGRSGRLVGCRHEHEFLHRAVAEARAGDLRVLLIEGEAGIGKTRSALELMEEVRAAGDLVVSGHGIGLAWSHVVTDSGMNGR